MFERVAAYHGIKRAVLERQHDARILHVRGFDVDGDNRDFYKRTEKTLAAHVQNIGRLELFYQINETAVPDKGVKAAKVFMHKGRYYHRE
jgi:hypothetical protein